MTETLGKSKLTVQISGGLGNQLFMLVRAVGLGYELSDSRVVAEVATSAFKSKTRALHRIDLATFLGPTQEMLSLASAGRAKRVARRLTNADQKVTIHEVGFSSLPSASLHKSTHLFGHFQSHRYFDHLRQLGAPFQIEPKDPSQEYRDLLKTLLGHKTGFLHVRRGDYVNHSSTIGLLNLDYFSLASERLRATGVDQIFVSSDDENWLRENRAQLPKFNYLDLSDLPFRGDHEVLAFASKVDAIACSNSSFSWWASMAGQTKIILKPSKWFKGMDDPLDLFDRQLVQEVPSSWV